MKMDDKDIIFVLLSIFVNNITCLCILTTNKFFIKYTIVSEVTQEGIFKKLKFKVCN